MMGAIFTAVGVPLETIAFVAGVDRIMDMMRTATNVTGDATVTVATATMLGEIDKAEHDKKVTQLNARYGRRRAMMERDIYGSGIKSPGRRPTIGRGGRRY